jgi:hypothetical protein
MQNYKIIWTNLNIVESMLLKLSNVDDSHSTLYFTKTTSNNLYVFHKLSTKIPRQPIFKFNLYSYNWNSFIMCHKIHYCILVVLVFSENITQSRGIQFKYHTLCVQTLMSELPVLIPFNQIPYMSYNKTTQGRWQTLCCLFCAPIMMNW